MMSSSFKLLTLCLIVLSVAILVTNNLYFTINYTKQLQDEFHSANTYLKRLRSTDWLEVVSQDIINRRVEMGVVDVDQIRDETPQRAKNIVTPYLKRKRNPIWFDVVAREFKDEMINIGLVHVDAALDGIQTKAKMVKVHFDHAGEGLRWSDLSPELVDENSTCPGIPMPRFEDYRELDVVVARIPHPTGYELDGLKDVSRLQVNLVVANLLVRSRRKGNGPLLAVFVESLNPMWEIFRCDDLLWNEDNTWIYKPEMTRINKLVLMPVGPCQFVAPPSDFGDFDRERRGRRTYDDQLPQPREAYVTILHTSEDYVCGAIVLAQSLVQTNTTKDLILLADDNISTESIEALRAAGWKTHRIERVRSPYSRKDAYNEWNYSKLRIWQLKLYDKLMFIDADLIVINNIDRFFVYPQLSAVGNYQKHLFNSGLMVVEPSQCTFDTLMEKMKVVESYNGGDQGFLNEMFAWWHRLPHELNFMKVFVDREDRVHLIDKGVNVVHYTGLKPWKCPRVEHDCNWDMPEFHRYASNSAHRMWWRIYRTMPEKLRPYCSRNTYTAKSPTSAVAMKL
ncbi:putative UDP-glucuronate:xylan alpha-glucuronosyltransferase 4 [Salvia miltiorrhiza]|uniref:putative UDP-glucuronate:xylan alpha-glucuronosyltransferase 4 n=1 Tax=Salvia miltiorrhiza TaxID=226208 RepID=UPI0025AC3E10|nr:putative UDP-glucuronate:xylan alpha-glucuronosyltransferase 4 [Salvia miltiorrhiza]